MKRYKSFTKIISKTYMYTDVLYVPRHEDRLRKRGYTRTDVKMLDNNKCLVTYTKEVIK